MTRVAAAGAFLAAIAVAAGAFGAHALEASATERDLEVWRTAASYLLVHSVALFALGLSGREALAWPSRLLLVGVCIFSGSLFALILLDLPILGAIAPVGGVLLVVGWLAAALALLRGTIRE